MKRAIIVISIALLAWTGQAGAATHSGHHTVRASRAHARPTDYTYGTDSPLQTVTLYPALAPVAPGPDWLVFNGTDEEQPVAQAGELTAHLQAAGLVVVEALVGTSNHAFDYWSLIEAQLAAEALS